MRTIVKCTEEVGWFGELWSFIMKRTFRLINVNYANKKIKNDLWDQLFTLEYWKCLNIQAYFLFTYENVFFWVYFRYFLSCSCCSSACFTGFANGWKNEYTKLGYKGTYFGWIYVLMPHLCIIYLHRVQASKTCTVKLINR